MQEPVTQLSPDGRTLSITREGPEGTRTVTITREPDAGPWTAESFLLAVSIEPSVSMQPGQCNTGYRFPTRWGAIRVDVMLGPPTWRAPRCFRDRRDGAWIFGWLRAGVAIRFME